MHNTGSFKLQVQGIRVPANSATWLCRRAGSAGSSSSNAPIGWLTPLYSLEQGRARGGTVCMAASEVKGRSRRQRHDLSSLDILRNDFFFLQTRAGADFATVKSAHDQVVAFLNPSARDRMRQRLDEELNRNPVDAAEELAQLEDSISSSRSPQQVQSNSSHGGPSSSSTPQPAAASANRRSTATAASTASVQSPPAPAAAPPARHATAPPKSAYAPRTQRNSHPSLRSSLDLPYELRAFWYPAEFSSRLKPDTLVPFELFGEQWVLFRDASGKPACVADACAHRACPLSLGSVVGGEVQCPYHGWQYDASGTCTRMPSTIACKGVMVRSLSTREADGLVWVWPAGDSPPPAEPLPTVAAPPKGFTVHAELMMEVPVEHGLLLENLLDLAHAPFTHTSTFAKGWPVPDVVKFNARRLLGGDWDPYPIDMAFEPPCMVTSTIGLAQPGKIERGVKASGCRNHLHQLHICLPAGPGRTRLLYRMSMDFLEWARFVPGIQKFWQSIAGQVLGEDLVLVAGQQERMLAGADVWATPVPYDKLGVRYRRWRNSLASADPRERAAAEADLVTLSAGELFDPESLP